MAEIAAMEQAELALMAMENGTMDSNSIAQWEQEMAAIERTLLGETSDIIAMENMGVTSLDDVLADELGLVEDHNYAMLDEQMDAELFGDDIGDEMATSNDLNDMNIMCKDTQDAYIEQISGLKIDLSSVKDMTERIAESLASIDPNMDNGLEGKAFIRKMYKLRGE